MLMLKINFKNKKIILIGVLKFDIIGCYIEFSCLSKGRHFDVDKLSD